jgi:Tfp pilus assembly pilus retraction ATPase PilT
METGTGDGMATLDSSLAKLFRQRRIPEQTVRSLARNPHLVMERARGI